MHIFLLLFTFSYSLFAETARIQDDDSNKGLSVSEAAYELKVLGPFTEVNASITVYNSNTFDSRASFYYKLPEDTSISGFALDINGKMRQASAVEKEKARVAFETEVRGKVDPALMEWNRGNVFKTQIYPIRGNGYRIIRVAYLIHTKETIEIPLDFKNLRKFTFAVSSQSQVNVSSPVEMLTLSSADKSKVELRADDCSISGTFKLNLKQDKCRLFSEKNKDQNLYWVYKAPLSIPLNKIPLKEVSSMAIFQDVSLSRDKADLAKEIELLKRLAAYINKPLTLKLFRFNISSEFIQKYTLDSEDSFKAFEKDYIECVFDGGTDFSKLSSSIKLSQADLKIIFTDGFNNFSNFKPNERVLTVNSSDEVDLFTLKNFGHNSINLNKLDISEAFEKLLLEKLEIKSENMETFGKVENGQIIATGILKEGENASFSIHQGGVELKKINISPKDPASYDIIRRYWCQQKLFDLMKNKVKNKREIIELGKSHSLVTPYTSMIVLENLRQYLDHDIRPPDEEAELQAQFDKQYKAKRPINNNGNAEITKAWESYKRWWKKYPEKKKDTPVANTSKEMTLIDQAIAEQGNEQNREIYNREFFEEVERNPVIPPPSEEPAPQEITDKLNQTPTAEKNKKIEELLNTLNDDQKPIKEKLAYLDNVIEDLNKENDMLKNDNGRLRAENRRLASQLEELKELYVKDRSVMKPGGNKAESSPISFSKWSNNSETGKLFNKAEKPLKKYLTLREKFRNSPGFYFECADFFFSKGEQEQALLILSNIIEIADNNSTLMRMAAYKMADSNCLDEAIYILKEIIELRSEEPHSYRDLALVLVKKASQSKDKLEKEQLYSEAAGLYKKIIDSSWYRENEFRGLSTILIEEYNNIILKSGKAFQLSPELKDKLDLDLRIVISWDSDMTDVDLHIIQPDEEKVYYGNRVSKVGGRMSNDYTRGLGPEVYGIRQAIPGEYKVYGKIYGADALFFNGQISVKLDIYLNYGRPNQIHKSTTVKITEKSKDIELAKIKLK